MDISRAIDNLKPRYKDMEKYAVIMKAIWETDISADRDLQRTFNGFYVIRNGQDWQKEYYGLFEECKTKDNLTYEYILREMNRRTGRVETSFSSKMLATINPQMPIWDSIVIGKLGYKPKTSGDKEKRITEAVEIYDDMTQWYQGFIKTDSSRKVIDAFDQAFPKFKNISDIKKIDFLLWGGGEENLLEVKCIELNGCIEVPAAVSLDEVRDKFIEFVESNHWYYGGGINEYKGEGND